MVINTQLLSLARCYFSKGMGTKVELNAAEKL